MSSSEGQHRGPETQYGYHEKKKPHEEPYILDKLGISRELAAVYDDLQQLPKGAIVLDIGVGKGRLQINAPKAGERPYRFLGVELDEGAVREYDEAAKERGLGEDKVIVADATELDYTDALGTNGLTADAAVSWRVLHNFGPEDQLKICRDIFQALPPGGSFHIAVVSDTDWKLDAARKAGKAFDGSGLIDTAGVMDRPENAGKTPDDPDWKSWKVYFFSKERLVELAKESGFEIVGDIKQFDEPSGFPHFINDPRNNPAHPDHDYDRSKVTYYYAHFRKPE